MAMAMATVKATVMEMETVKVPALAQVSLPGSLSYPILRLRRTRLTRLPQVKRLPQVLYLRRKSSWLYL
jgi:hypothetical protein